MRDLKKQIQRGFPDSKSKMKDGLDKYWRVRNRLRINKQGIVTMDDRMVVPDKLRGKACRIAHAAHQGVNSMHKALETRLYWPSMDKHLQEHPTRRNYHRRHRETDRTDGGHLH